MLVYSSIIFAIELFFSIHDCSAIPIRKIDYIEEDLKWSENITLAFFIGVASLICIVAFGILCICCGPSDHLFKTWTNQNRYRRNFTHSRRSAPQSEITIFPPPGYSHNVSSSDVQFESLPDIATRRQSGHLNNITKDWFAEPQKSFSRSQLQYVKKLGSGWFGQIILGRATGILNNVVNSSPTIPVVVKNLREDATVEEQYLFLKELRPYKELNHPNLLRVLGFCLEKHPFLVILQFCSKGDLKSVLKKDKTLTHITLLRMAKDVASGLSHMHEHGLIHTDLAARNCLVEDDYSVKIGDYGFNIDTGNYKNEYYLAENVALPIRWCSPETLKCTETTIETIPLSKEANVWTLGVVIWEILSRAQLPYADLDEDSVIQCVILDNARRLKVPIDFSLHPEKLNLILSYCWLPSHSRSIAAYIEILLAQLCNNITFENSSSLADFEYRWHKLSGEQKISQIHNVPTTKTTSEMRFESDFNPANFQITNTASKINHNGSDDDLESRVTAKFGSAIPSWLGLEVDQPMDSFTEEIRDAIEKLDEALANESINNTQEKRVHFKLGKDSLVLNPPQSGLHTTLSDRDDENLTMRLEQEDFSELVRKKSQSVQDLMRLTVVDDGSDSDKTSQPGSLLCDFNGQNLIPEKIFSSESNLNEACRDSGFMVELEKLQAEHKYSIISEASREGPSSIEYRTEASREGPASIEYRSQSKEIQDPEVVQNPNQISAEPDPFLGVVRPSSINKDEGILYNDKLHSNDIYSSPDCVPLSRDTTNCSNLPDIVAHDSYIKCNFIPLSETLQESQHFLTNKCYSGEKSDKFLDGIQNKDYVNVSNDVNISDINKLEHSTQFINDTPPSLVNDNINKLVNNSYVSKESNDSLNNLNELSYKSEVSNKNKSLNKINSSTVVSINEFEISNDVELSNKLSLSNEHQSFIKCDVSNKVELSNQGQKSNEVELHNISQLSDEVELANKSQKYNEVKLHNKSKLSDEVELANQGQKYNEVELRNKSQLSNEVELSNKGQIFNGVELSNQSLIEVEHDSNLSSEDEDKPPLTRKHISPDIIFNRQQVIKGDDIVFGALDDYCLDLNPAKSLNEQKQDVQNLVCKLSNDDSVKHSDEQIYESRIDDDDILYLKQSKGWSINETDLDFNCSDGNDLDFNCSDGNDLDFNCSDGNDLDFNCSNGNDLDFNCSNGNDLDFNCSNGNDLHFNCSDGNFSLDNSHDINKDKMIISNTSLSSHNFDSDKLDEFNNLDFHAVENLKKVSVNKLSDAEINDIENLEKLTFSELREVTQCEELLAENSENDRNYETGSPNETENEEFWEQQMAAWKEAAAETKELLNQAKEMELSSTPDGELDSNSISTAEGELDSTSNPQTPRSEGESNRSPYSSTDGLDMDEGGTYISFDDAADEDTFRYSTDEIDNLRSELSLILGESNEPEETNAEDDDSCNDFIFINYRGMRSNLSPIKEEHCEDGVLEYASSVSCTDETCSSIEFTDNSYRSDGYLCKENVDENGFISSVHSDGHDESIPEDSKDSLILEDLETNVDSNLRNNKLVIGPISLNDSCDDLLLVDTETNKVTLVDSGRPKSTIAFVTEKEMDDKRLSSEANLNGNLGHDDVDNESLPYLSLTNENMSESLKGRDEIEGRIESLKGRDEIEGRIESLKCRDEIEGRIESEMPSYHSYFTSNFSSLPTQSLDRNYIVDSTEHTSLPYDVNFPIDYHNNDTLKLLPENEGTKIKNLNYNSDNFISKKDKNIDRRLPENIDYDIHNDETLKLGGTYKINRNLSVSKETKSEDKVKEYVTLSFLGHLYNNQDNESQSSSAECLDSSENGDFMSPREMSHNSNYYSLGSQLESDTEIEEELPQEVEDTPERTPLRTPSHLVDFVWRAADGVSKHRGGDLEAAYVPDWEETDEENNDDMDSCSANTEFVWMPVNSENRLVKPSNEPIAEDKKEEIQFEPYIDEKTKFATYTKDDINKIESYVDNRNKIKSHNNEEINIIESYKDEVNKLESHEDELNRIESHEDELNEIESHEDELNRIESHEDELNEIESHEYELNIIKSHEDELNRIESHEHGLNKIESHVVEAEPSSEAESESGEEDFTPSTWDRQLTPQRSLIKSPETSSSEKKQVRWKQQRHHRVYEYPPEPQSWHSEVPKQNQRRSWETHSLDFLTLSDWEIGGDEFLGDDSEDFEEFYAPQRRHPFASQICNLAPLTYDTSSEGFIGDTCEFYSPGSSYPFSRSSFTPSDFFPRKEIGVFSNKNANAEAIVDDNEGSTINSEENSASERQVCNPSVLREKLRLDLPTLCLSEGDDASDLQK